MKRLLIFPLLLALGGCAGNPQAFQEFKANALEVIAKIKAGAKLAAAEINEVVSEACGGLPLMADGIRAVVSTIPNPGPKTRSAIGVATTSYDTAAKACAAYANAPTVAGRASIALKLWAAYQSGKAAVNTANAAGGA